MIVLMNEKEQAEATELRNELQKRLHGRTFLLLVDSWEEGGDGDIYSNAASRDDIFVLLDEAALALGLEAWREARAAKAEEPPK